MKIRFRDRLILILSGLLSLIAGLLLAAWSQWRAPDFTPDAPAEWLRTLCAVIGALAALSGVCLLFFVGRRPGRRQDFVTQKTDNGELRIAVKAIEKLVLKCIDLHDEIRLTSMTVQNARSGVTVDLTVSLANNISIPLAVAALQKQIKQYLAASSGVEVREVRVSVEATEEEWEAAASQDNAAEEEKPASGPKRPMHQRLFGPSDQPMIVPEPPVQVPSESPVQESQTPSSDVPETEPREQSSPDAMASCPPAEPEALSQAAEAPMEDAQAPDPEETADTPSSPSDRTPTPEDQPEDIDGGSQP